MSNRTLQPTCQKNTCHNHAMCMYTPCRVPKVEASCNGERCEEECMGYSDCRKPEPQAGRMSDTIGRIVSRAIGRIDGIITCDSDQRRGVTNIVAAAVAQALAGNAPGWISVKERLPEPGIEVIYYHDTHWQPIPTPPQEEEE